MITAVNDTCILDPEGSRRIIKGIRRRRNRVGVGEKHGGLKSESESKRRKDFWTANSLSKHCRWFGRQDKSYLHVLSTWNELPLKYVESQISFASQTHGRCREPTAKSWHHHVSTLTYTYELRVVTERKRSQIEVIEMSSSVGWLGSAFWDKVRDTNNCCLSYIIK